ncbi:MAG: hypothetical protein ACI9O6_000796 [Glaciecola sp.]|jgi:hypothetical protein
MLANRRSKWNRHRYIQHTALQTITDKKSHPVGGLNSTWFDIDFIIIKFAYVNFLRFF